MSRFFTYLYEVIHSQLALLMLALTDRSLLNTFSPALLGFLAASPFPSNRHRWSTGHYLEGKRENYQVCSVRYCVQQLYTVNYTHIWTELTVLWIGFCLTGPISLCFFVYVSFCVWLYIVCMFTGRLVTWWGGQGCSLGLDVSVSTSWSRDGLET